jgi:hypothetical protein
VHRGSSRLQQQRNNAVINEALMLSWCIRGCSFARPTVAVWPKLEGSAGELATASRIRGFALPHLQVLAGESDVSKPVPINTKEPITLDSPLFKGTISVQIRCDRMAGAVWSPGSSSSSSSRNRNSSGSNSSRHSTQGSAASSQLQHHKPDLLQCRKPHLPVSLDTFMLLAFHRNVQHILQQRNQRAQTTAQSQPTNSSPPTSS